MNKLNREIAMKDNPKTHEGLLLSVLILLGMLARSLHAQGLPGEEEGWSFPTPLNSWTFGDTNTWTSDYGYAPISFTNLASSSMGDLGGRRTLMALII